MEREKGFGHWQTSLTIDILIQQEYKLYPFKRMKKPGRKKKNRIKKEVEKLGEGSDGAQNFNRNEKGWRWGRDSQSEWKRELERDRES